MIKKEITYKDLDGQTRTDEFYFHLSTAELAEMQIENEGLVEYLQNVIKSRDGSKIIAEFKKILAKSYGVRSDDGKRFIKSPELWNDFTSHMAYSEFFMELLTNADAAAEFIRGIVPEDLGAQIPNVVPEAKEVPGRPVKEVELPEPPENNPKEDDLPGWFKENRQPTKRELMKMSSEELAFAMRMRNSLPQ